MLSHTYLQLLLDESSRDYLTMHQHAQGLIQVCWTAFWISQRTMEHLREHCNLISGQTEEHLCTLLDEVLQRLEAGMQLKCIFMVRSIEY